jgi:RecJ-like exonuclease
MSITFSIKNAPYRKVMVDCLACDGTGHYYDACCPYCKGTGKCEDVVCDLPEVNMANGNALDMLRALGEEPDDCGEWPLSRLHELMTKLTLLKCGITSVFLEKDTVREGNIIDCGRDSEYVIRRSGQLYEVVATAFKMGRAVTWG